MSASVAYGSSQARGWIRAAAKGLHHSHSNSRFLTHWVRPGIEPASLWIWVGFVTAQPQWELLSCASRALELKTQFDFAYNAVDKATCFLVLQKQCVIIIGNFKEIGHSLVAQWVKDLRLSLLWPWLLLWQRLDPWPGNYFCLPQALPHTQK